MKLHLPKLLLTAIIAAASINVTAQAAIGWGAQQPEVFFTGADNVNGVSRDGVEGVSVNENGVRIVESIDATSKNSVTFWADLDNNQAVQARVGTLSTKANITLGVTKPSWGPRYYDALTIEQVNVADKGVINLNIAYDNAANREQINKVVINSVDGSVGNITVKTSNELTIGGTDTINTINGTLSNAGVLTLQGTVNLGNTLSNSGTLNLNGAVKLDNLDVLDSYVSGSLTNETHGFREGQITYNIANGGTINTTEGFSITLGGTDITANLGITGSAITYTATDSPAISGTIYEITSGYTNTIVYNGTTGETAAATGFLMENGTTLKLAGSTAALEDGITIAAGDSGAATLDFTAGTHDFDSLVNVQSGVCNLNISGEGTVVSTNNTGAAGFIRGEVSITDGAELVLSNYDALGYGGSSTPSVSIEDATLAVGGRLTLTTDLNLRGGATITVADKTLDGNNVPMLQSFGSEWTVSGEGNVIESGVIVRLDHNLAIDVTEGGELSIKGSIQNGTGNGQLTKTGDGKLILEGAATLENGLHLTGGSVDVLGQTVIKKASTLGGAITVASTGELTLNSTYTLTGSLTVSEGGKVIGGSDLIGSNLGYSAPAEGTNGWNAITVTILKSSADATVSGLNKVSYNGQEYNITTSESAGTTSHQFQILGSSYYVQNTAEAVEYSSASGLTQAEAIYMSNGTTLNVRENLNFTKLTITDGAKVNFDVQGAKLSINRDGNINNITSMTIGQGGEVCLANWNTSLGNNNERVNVLLTDGGKFTFGNGNAAANNGVSGGSMNVNMTVNGSGVLGGSTYGDSSNIMGEVKGNGTLSLENAVGGNKWTISATVKDSDGGKLGITSNTTVTMSGANTYSGGTTVTGGKLTVSNASALGTGAVEVKNGATLELASNLTVSSNMTVEEGGKLIFNNGDSLSINGSLTLDASAVQLAFDITAPTDVVLATTTAGVNLTGAWGGIQEYTYEGSVYSVGLSTADNALSLVFRELTEISTSVTSFGIASTEGITTLTLSVDAALSETAQVMVDLISDEIMEQILTELDGTTMVSITLLGTNGISVEGTSEGNVLFINEDGDSYRGELVKLGEDNVAWQYDVTMIPEPTTTALSLLALCGLAARRRRK